MKKVFTVLLLHAAFAGFCQLSCVITKVIDGDTYQVLQQGKLQTVRLKNVDAPELKQFFGIAAKDSLSQLLLRKVVTIEPEKMDLYGRLLATITIGGRVLDSQMIAKGWAWHYLQYSDNAGLSIYETAAKRQALGLWKCVNPLPPWIWRQLSKRNKRLYEVCQPQP